MCSLTYAAVIALGSCAALMSQAQSTSSTSLDQPSIIRAKKTNPQDGLEYVWIKPGTYFTGCDHDDKECIGWERPRHAIVIDKGYWMGETEVTLECPIFCAVGRVSVAQLFLSSSSRRRGCGEVGSA